MEIKKPGRPTEGIKEATIRLRVDKRFIEDVDAEAGELNTTRSEFIRNSLAPKNISYKRFDDLLGMSKLNFLEKASQKCIKFLSESFSEISELDLKDNFPASIDRHEEVVKVKYPTIKIKALIRQYDGIEIVKRYLADFEDDIFVFEALSITIERRRQNSVFFPEIMCLKSTVQENKDIAKLISEKLQSHEIQSEFWPACYEVKIPVKIVEKEDCLYIKNAKA